MSASFKGRHRKPSSTHKTIAKIAVVGLGATIPITLGIGSANAASIGSWDRIASCESGDMNTPNSGHWNLSYGDADSTGGLQIQKRTWDDFNGPALTGHAYPYQATKEQQIMIAEKILASQGPGAWVCNNPGHGIASGALSVDSGSPVFNDPQPDPQPAPQSDPAPAPAPAPAPKPIPKPNADGTYTVVSGDYLYKIAKEQLGDGSKWQDLYAMNKDVIGGNADVIEIGMVLKLHDTTSYSVVKGDTLYGIAKAHGAGAGVDNWHALYDANKSVVGDNPDLIYPGQILSVPVVGSSPVTPPPAKTADPAPVTKPAPKPAPASHGWVAPIDAPVTQGFHNPGNYGTGWHTGVDFSASSGTHVKAVSDSTVVHAGYGGAGAAYGNNIVLKLADGNYVLYAHLSSNRVSVGQHVSAGDWIGNVGATGNATGPHLHFELRNSPTQYGPSVFMNPITYLANHGVTL